MYISKYLRHLKNSNYLPKEQLKRYRTALGITNSQLSKMMEVSPNSLNVMRSTKAKNQPFRKVHAQRIKSYFNNRKSISESSRLLIEELKQQKFILVYDAQTWPDRIGVAKNFLDMQTYDAVIDSFLQDSGTPGFEPLKKNADSICVISLKEVADYFDVSTSVVLKSFSELEESNDEDDDWGEDFDNDQNEEDWADPE